MKNKKNKGMQINYLDLIPKRAAIKYHRDYYENIVLEIENTGFFNTIAQNLFNKPKITNIHLDEQGTFLWPLIDGEKTVMELAKLQKEKFKEEAEPLYPRIIKYFQILESYKFISFINMPSKK